jgi:hypothetical protein
MKRRKRENKNGIMLRGKGELLPWLIGQTDPMAAKYWL